MSYYVLVIEKYDVDIPDTLVGVFTSVGTVNAALAGKLLYNRKFKELAPRESASLHGKSGLWYQLTAVAELDKPVSEHF